MRTLIKERVNLSVLANDSGVLSTDLIGDGTSEVIARRLNEIHEDTDWMELRKNFSENFKRQLASMKRIDEEEV